MAIRHILVPTDFTPDADAALRYAVMLAQQLGATVQLLHVLEPLAPATCVAAAAAIAGLQFNRVLNAKRRLRECVSRLPGARSGIGREVLIGAPAPSIVNYARQCCADLIVMGAAGEQSAEMPNMGRVVNAVGRTAFCAVVTVRATERSAQAGQRIA